MKNPLEAFRFSPIKNGPQEAEWDKNRFGSGWGGYEEEAEGDAMESCLSDLRN